MKKRRLLALVLCFVMLFSDATSTFASDLSDTPVVITETSDENEENGSEVTTSALTETEVPEKQTTETTETTEVPGTETAVGTETVETTEIVEDTELVETTELEEESTELIIEETQKPERLGEGETLTASVFYMNGEESVEIGDGQYATLAEAKTAIETFLSENTDFAGTIHVSLNSDTTVSGDILALDHDNAWIELHMNGHVLTVTADTYVRANIESSENQGKILLNDNYTLTLLPTCQVSDGMTNTDISNIQIVSEQQNPTGKVIVGECRNLEGALVNRSIHLNDIPIINVNDIVFQGDMSYFCNEELIIANELRVENAFDDEAGIHQYISIDAEVQGENVIWNGNGQVTDLTVSDTLTAYTDWQMAVRGSLEVNNIDVTAGGDVNSAFCIAKATILDGDNGNALLSEASVTISGAITENGDMNYPIAIQKKNIIQREVSDEYGSWIEEEHEDGRAFEVDEVVLTLGENSTVDAADIELQQWENDSRMMLKKENSQLIACEMAVEVNAHVWNEEAEDWESVGTGQYDSFGAAVAGIAEDFADVNGRFDIILFKDAELTENVTLPANAIEINMDSAGMWVEITDEEGNVTDAYDHRVRRTFIFNGHTLTVQGNVYWRESVQILNGADTDGSIMAQEFNWEWVDAAESFGLADGTAINRSEETNVVIDGVNIMAPGGRVVFRAGGSEYKYQVNGELLGGSAEFGGSTWTVLRLVLTEENGDGLFIGEEADVTITDKLSARAGNWAEVRGKLTLAKLIVNPHSEDPYANYNIQIVTGYNGNGWDEEPDELSYQGSVIFDGSLIGNGNFASSPIRLEKAEVYRYVAIDEEGNIIWDNEEEGIPCYNEDHFGDLDFASGETVAIVNNSAVDTSIFAAGGSDAIFVLEGKELKAYKAAVRVDVYWEEEDTGAEHNYLTLEDAFANMEKDFGGKPGHYTFNIVDDVKMSKNLTVPSFVTSMRMNADWQWIEHCDEEGNPIDIYDDEGNWIGTEGHDRTDFATLDMNGFTLTSAAPIEFMEGLQIVSTAVDKNGKVVKGKIIVTAEEDEGATVSFNQANDVELVSDELDENGNFVQVERNEDYTWAFISNVDVYVENGRVNLWSTWCNYVIDGDITAELLALRGNWTVDNVTVTTDLCLEPGWYDEVTDEGEPEGFLSVENLTIDGGHVYNGGRIFVNDTFTAKNNAVIDNQALVIADTFAMETGAFYNAGQASVKTANIKEFYNCSYWFSYVQEEDNPETDEDETVIGEAVWGAEFYCDTFTQPKTGASYLEGASVLIINKKATIYNLYIGGYNGDVQNSAGLYWMPGAEIAIEGSVNNFVGVDLRVGIIDTTDAENAAGIEFTEIFDSDDEGNTWSWYEPAFVDADGSLVKKMENGLQMQVLTKNQKLYTTTIKEFPTDYVCLDQSGENAQYWSVYQKGNEIRVGGNWIRIIAVAGQNSEVLGEFSVWSEAAEFIATLSNPDISYVIEISDDLDLEGALTLPAKAKMVVIAGAREDEQIELTYVGDLSLGSIVAFENIKLNAVDKNGVPYKSAVKLNGHILQLMHSTADFASVTGTKTSGFGVHDGSEVTVAGAIKTLEFLDVIDSNLTVGTEITGVQDLNMASARLEAGTKITVVDIYPFDDKCQIVYGGNASTNILTISGNVYSNYAYEGFENLYGITEDGSIAGEGDEAIAFIRAAAIDISVKALEAKENGYETGDVLVNAPKVASNWFVVGSEYDEFINENDETYVERTRVGSLTHKSGNQIRYGATVAGAVELQVWDDAAGGYVTYDSYATLQDAFTAIDSLGNKDGNYYIVLKQDMDSENIPSVLKTPSKARYVQVWAEDEAKTIYYDSELKLNCTMSMGNVILAPQSAKSKITLGDYALDLLCGTKLAEGCKIASVTGSGVAKNSAFDIHDTSITISGDLNNVGTLWIQSAELIVEGKINVGDIASFVDTDIPEETRIAPTLVGTATVTRKNGKVTKFVPQITINGEMDYSRERLYIELREKAADGYKPVDFSAEEMTDILANGIQLASAPKVASMMILPSEKNNVDAENYAVAKENGYLVYLHADNVALTLYYPKTIIYTAWDDDAEDWVEREEVFDILTGCKTFTDAVTEINNLKTKQDYAIILKPASSTASLKNPTQLKMPNKNYVETLQIYCDTEDERYDLCYTGNITLTSDVNLRNVSFVQVAKNKAGEYVSVDELQNGYPAPVSISTGGYDLTIKGEVVFNTPVKLDGAKKGTLNVLGTLETETSAMDDSIRVYEFVRGSITNFAEVNIDTEVSLVEYGTVSSGKTTYTSPTFTATTLNVVNGGRLDIESDANKATLTVTNLEMPNGAVSVRGNATIKNAVLDGASTLGASGKLALTNVTLNGAPMLTGITGFTISGTLTSNTPNAVLMAVQDKDSKSTLNITGKVVLDEEKNNKIGIAVVDNAGEGLVTLSGAPEATGMLLSATTATADMFVPASIEGMDNVDGKAPYSDEKSDGYFLMKSGTGIYVYYGDQLGVALCAGDETDGDLAGANILGYYTDFKAAVAAIDALKDKEATYTLVLLNDVNSADAPAGITLPQYAANVGIVSKANQEAKNLYFTGKISLKAPTTFENVVFQPMTAKKAGTAFDIETGVHYLALHNVAVGTTEGMAFGNIKGNAKQETEINAANLVITGSVTNSAKLSVLANATIKGDLKVTQLAMTSNLTVDGSVTVNELMTQGDVTLDAQKNSVTIKDINVYSGTPTIIYGKNSKGAPNLTINGLVSGNNAERVVLNLQTDMTVEQYVLIGLTLPANQRLANIAKASQTSFTMQLNGTDVLEGSLLRANDGVYIIDGNSTARAQNVTLAGTDINGNEINTKYLDLSQAVTAINVLANPEATYTLYVNSGYGISDTNVLDKTALSGITLPKVNMASEIRIAGVDWNNESDQATVMFSGNISYSGKLVLDNIMLRAEDQKGNATDTKISVTKDKKGVAELEFVNVTTYADYQLSTGKILIKGFISQISGTKNVTDVTMMDSDLRISSSISNVDTLILKNSQLVTCGAVTVNNVTIADDTTATGSAWDALAKTTVGNFNVESWNRDNGYIASKQTAKTLVPMFTISGNVNIVDGSSAVPVKVVTAASKTNNIEYVDVYKDVSLVVATTAAADSFVAYPFADSDATNDEGLSAEKLISYKDTKNTVKNGNADEMKVLLSYEGGATYAKSYAEAVTLINNIGNKETVYTIEFLTEGDVTANGTTYGALTFPTKAKEVFITGQVDADNNDVSTTVLKYTGTMKPGVSVTFANIILTEGTVSKTGVFTPSYAVTPTVSSANVIIGFEAGASTLKKDNETETADLVFTSISGNKGSVAIFDRKVKVEKDAGLATLYVSDNAVVDVLGKLTVNTINVVNISSEDCVATVAADGAMTITNINGVRMDNDSDALLLDTRYTAMKKATDTSVSQLTVNGEINDIEVGITVEMYDFATKSYHSMTTEEAEALLIVDENATPAKNQKIATMPKARVDELAILLETEDDLQPIATSQLSEQYATIVKHDGGVYMTNLPPVLGVIGYASVYEDGEVVGSDNTYMALFLNWDQAVKEIDKIADKDAFYEMVLLRNAGQTLNGDINPIKNLSLPSKAKEVIVVGENIFFTGKITAKTNTVFTNIGLMAVKQVKQGKDTWYESTSYDVAVGNYYVVMDNIRSYAELYNEQGEGIGWFDNMPGTVSGSKKGIFEVHRSSDEGYNNLVATKISGVGTVMFWDYNYHDTMVEGAEQTAYFVPKGITGVENLVVNPYVFLESWEAAISVKNLVNRGAVVYGKDLTVTGSTELQSAVLVAGTDVVGDGTLKLANVVLHDNNNELSAKQDKNGKSLLQINGTINTSEEFGEETPTEEAIRVLIRYNNDRACAQLYNEMLLLTAPKADASWFVPFYTYTAPRQVVGEDGNPIFDEETGEPVYVPVYDENGKPVVDEETGEPVYEEEYFVGMGWYNEYYRVYKLGKGIYYGYGGQ